MLTRPLVADFDKKMDFLLGAAVQVPSLRQHALPDTQKMLAKKLGVEANRLNQWIRLRSYPPAFLILNISRLYGFGPTDDFLSENEDVTLRECIDLWFLQHWTCWYNPLRRSFNHAGEDQLSDFIDAYKKAADFQALMFQPCIRSEADHTSEIAAIVRKRAAAMDSSSSPSALPQAPHGT